MQTNIKILLGLGGGLASAGGGYLLLKPSAPKYGVINGTIRLPPKGEWIYEEYIHLDHHFKKKQKNFFKERKLSKSPEEHIDTNTKEGQKKLGEWWQGMQKKISDEVKKEFSHEIKPEDVWHFDIDGVVIRLIRDICSGTKETDMVKKYCRTDS